MCSHYVGKGEGPIASSNGRAQKEGPGSEKCRIRPRPVTLRRPSITFSKVNLRENAKCSGHRAVCESLYWLPGAKKTLGCSEGYPNSRIWPALEGGRLFAMQAIPTRFSVSIKKTDVRFDKRFGQAASLTAIRVERRTRGGDADHSSPARLWAVAHATVAPLNAQLIRRPALGANSSPCAQDRMVQNIFREIARLSGTAAENGQQVSPAEMTRKIISPIEQLSV
jgi:hypothetical protein